MIPINSLRVGLHCAAVFLHNDDLYIELAWTERGAINKMIKTLEKRGII